MTAPKQQLLSDYWHLFEGVIPSVVATASRLGMPNISYISQVFYVDEGHVALSNQFMSKLVANVMENPRAQAIVVDPIAGRQCVLDLAFDHSETSGALFEQFAARISAITAHRGMEKVMRLKSADIYRVICFDIQEFAEVPAAIALPPSRINLLSEAASLSMALAKLDDLDQSIDMVLSRLESTFGMKHCMVLLADSDRQLLTAIASRGYDRQGVGAEVAWGKGVIGMAAEKACSMRFSNVGRHFLMADSIDTSQYLSADKSRVIPQPGLNNPQSVMAVPMIAQGEVRGVIYVESPDWLAFTPFDEQALSIVAGQLAVSVTLLETLQEIESDGEQLPLPPARSPAEQDILIHCYAYDDSLFINHEYVIKGVPGRILWRMLQIHTTEGRTEFTNRELRLDAALKLPEYKDNLEARLLLLRRRLAEKKCPVRVLPAGRGRIGLELDGHPVLTRESHS
jgi:adenylate cyclase